MTRISVIEQYDNKDVIQQIYNLKDDLNSIREDAESLAEITETANTAKETADTAISMATANAASISDRYTKAEVDSLISSAERFQVLAVSQLPETGQSSVLYILTSEEPNGMYTWQDGAYTKVGTLGVEVQVDAELSETSANAVQNRVIALRISSIEETHAQDISSLDSRISENTQKADSATSLAQEAKNTAQTAQSTSNSNVTRIQDLQASLDGKQDILTAGSNITIVDNVISASGTGGGSVSVDAYLSETSENPVQNKVIASSINAMRSDVDSNTSRIAAVEGEVDVALEYGTEIGDLQGRVGTLETEQGSIDSRLESAEDDISSLYSSKQNTITGAASTVTASNLTSNKVVVTTSAGKLTTMQITPDELVMLSGSTENIQDAIDGIRDQLGTSWDYDVGYIGNTSSSASTLSMPQTITFYQAFEGIPAVFVTGGWNDTTNKNDPVQIYDLSASGMKIDSGSDWKYISYLAIYPRSR